MNAEERLKKQRELIELIGHYHDKEGFQPIAGRIIGLLMVMDKEQYTFDEITEELQISKSSASNVLRNLEIREQIEYVTLPGDRKRYFQLKKQDAGSIVSDFRKKINGIKELLAQIIELKADKNSLNAVFFQNMIKTLEIVLKTFDEIIQ